MHHSIRASHRHNTMHDTSQRCVGIRAPATAVGQLSIDHLENVCSWIKLDHRRISSTHEISALVSIPSSAESVALPQLDISK